MKNHGRSVIRVPKMLNPVFDWITGIKSSLLLSYTVKLVFLFFTSFAYSLFLSAAIEEPLTWFMYGYCVMLFSYWFIVELLFGRPFLDFIRKNHPAIVAPFLIIVFCSSITLYVIWAVSIWTFIVHDGTFFINLALFLGDAPAFYLWHGIILFFIFFLVSGLSRLNDKVETHQYGEEFENDTTTDDAKKLIAQSNGRTYIIDPDEITRIESKSYYANIILENATYLVRDSLESLADRLKSLGFYRIHRSHIVNLTQIKQIEKKSKNSSVAVLKNGDVLPISRAKLREFKEQVLQ